MNWTLLLAKINKKADKEHTHELIEHEHDNYAKKEHFHSLNDVEGMDIIHSGDIDKIIDNALK